MWRDSGKDRNGRRCVRTNLDALSWDVQAEIGRTRRGMWKLDKERSCDSVMKCPEPWPVRGGDFDQDQLPELADRT